jgi:hypothetical protein
MVTTGVKFVIVWCMAFEWMVPLLLLYSAHACTIIDVVCALEEGVQTCDMERLQMVARKPDVQLHNHVHQQFVDVCNSWLQQRGRTDQTRLDTAWSHAHPLCYIRHTMHASSLPSAQTGQHRLHRRNEMQRCSASCRGQWVWHVLADTHNRRCP